ncbi:hypothetical protein ACBJ59_52495 [Nonomuraea sp. MTCD27]|uniref:hypothetical protein n=1 Tax=Nonomuraea sp. MTCD27 TaxID=1676747 RepID=UPI0035C07466
MGDRDRGVVHSCGRCRQVLLDYVSALEVIVRTNDGLRLVPVTGLLPESYLWTDHQLDYERSAPLSTSWRPRRLEREHRLLRHS